MRSFALVLSLSLVACTGSRSTGSLPEKSGTATPTAAPASAAAASSATPQASLEAASVVATIDGKPVTGGDLNESIRDDVSKETESYMDHLQRLREEGLDELIAEKLIEREAAAQKLTKEALVKQEIAGKIKPPSDDDVKAFYEKVVKPRYDVPLDAVKPQILEQLSQDGQGTRFKAYVEELRAKYKVQVTLPVRRVQVSATGPSRGPADAKVTIVEFSDFQCPYCGKATPTVEEVMKKYDGKVRLVFREFPLPMHQHAAKAAEAALCANDQGKFWPMYDKMFANQERLGPDDLSGFAKDAGLDADKFKTCLESGKMKSAVEADMAAGKAAGVDGTPAFFINGRPYSGAQPLEKFSEVIDSELKAG